MKARHLEMKSTVLILSLAALTPQGFAASHSSVATADAYVANGPNGNLANGNYGGGGALALAAPGLPNGEFQSVLKFSLEPARTAFDAQFGAGQWSIDSVSLQISSSLHNNAIYNPPTLGKFSVSSMLNTSWTEGNGNASNPGNTGITFNTLQNTFSSASDEPLGIFDFDGGTSGTHQYTLELTDALRANIASGGTVSLRLAGADASVSYQFTSRAGSVGSQPQIVVNVVPEPGILALFGLGGGWFLWNYSRKRSL